MIRLATTDDASVMHRIATLAYGKYTNRLDRPPLPMSYDYEQITKEKNTYVLVDASSVVGMVTYIPHADHVLLRNLAILPELQGRGYGRTLVEFVESEATKRNLVEVRLWTRAEMSENISMYERLGYTVTSRATVDGYARVYFAKQLAVNY
jgi:ribosomal protein S18 acetylase RimI-like enzyme